LLRHHQRLGLHGEIYGGTPLPPAPVGVAPGWVSEAFYMPEPGRGLMLAAGIALLWLLERLRSRR
jgi:hypothetical protein